MGYSHPGERRRSSTHRLRMHRWLAVAVEWAAQTPRVAVEVSRPKVVTGAHSVMGMVVEKLKIGKQKGLLVL